MSAPPFVHVIGASGRSGIALAHALGARLIPVVRDHSKWTRLGFSAQARVAELTDGESLAAALRDATHVVSCVHARHAPQIVAAAPPAARLIFLGSTRKFTRWPDDHGNGVLAGEAAFLASGRDGVMLHPTMIYGADGEDNVRRLAALTRRLPVLPLPGGGQARVQPIYQGDVTRAILAALDRAWGGPRALTIAGPSPMAYADFLRAVAMAAGSGRPRIFSVPAAPLMALAVLVRLIPGLPKVGPAEIRRLLEDKAFDIAPMRALLGFDPIALEAGLALTFRCAHYTFDLR